MNNQKVKAFLVDDEPMALSSMERMLNKHCPNISIVGKSMNPEEAITMINTLKPQVLFLDIAMPRMDGFSLLKEITYNTIQTIFVTAYDEYAIQAFKTAAVDYLLKPVDKKELIEAVEKVYKLIESDETENHIAALFERLQENQKTSPTIGLPTMEGLHFVKKQDILYCKSDGNYSEIILADGNKIVISRQIKYLEEKLNTSPFARVHKSYLINLNYVEKYLKGRGGTIVLTNGDHIPVSVRKKNDFLDSF